MLCRVKLYSLRKLAMYLIKNYWVDDIFLGV